LTFPRIINMSRDFSHQVLSFAIQKLQSAGYRLVSVADCLGQAPYLNTQPPGQRDVRAQVLLFTWLSLNEPFPRQAGLVERVQEPDPEFTLAIKHPASPQTYFFLSLTTYVGDAPTLRSFSHPCKSLSTIRSSLT
jgi:hypothetical protein